jgi:basic membrane protein A and related proteins
MKKLLDARRGGGLRRSLAAISCVLTVALVIAACGSGGGGNTASSGGSGKKEIKVGVILIGPKNDKSFNQAAYEGVQKAIAKYPQLKLTSVLENRATDQQQTDAVNTLAGVDNIVVGVSATFGPVFDATADKYPNVTFLTIAGYPKQYHKNVYSLVFDRTAGYEAGALAAALTKKNIVGFVGGAEIPPTIQAMNGFVAAVHRANPNIKTLKNVIGDFNDVPKALAATKAMLSDGADVIMPYLDAGIVGSYQAARSMGKIIPMFKLDIFDCSQYSNIIGADIGDNTVAASKLLEGVVSHQLKPAGVTIFAGLQDPSLQRLQLCPKYAANKKIASLNRDTVAGINDGKIKMPPGVLNPRPAYPYREGFNGPVKNANATG